MNCHGAEREGGTRMVPWFWIKAPAITPHALFEAHGESAGHGDHAAYTEATLRRAIGQGIDPSGEPLDDTMPRWSMSEQDLDDLIDYLRGSEKHVD